MKKKEKKIEKTETRINNGIITEYIYSGFWFVLLALGLVLLVALLYIIGLIFISINGNIFCMDSVLYMGSTCAYVVIVNSVQLGIVLCIIVLTIYLIIKNRDNKIKNLGKKILFIVFSFFLVFSRAGLTKIGEIPNLLGIQYLYPEEQSWKPIIYLYPTEKTEVHVKLGKPKNLSHTYPKYNSEKGRNVIAQPNGDLKDIETGRKLYALYREGKSNNETNFDEGFVVAGKDIIPFLEEKLSILGLNEREAEEFIVYWLPQMEDNEWNLIRFETEAEQNKSMPLNITPIPDSVIRVMMDWKAIDEPIDIPEQELTTPERSGFTVIEWGGSPRN